MHGLKTIDIKRQVQHYGLENDPDVLKLRPEISEEKVALSMAKYECFQGSS